MDCKKCGKEVDKKQKVFAKKDSQLCRQWIIIYENAVIIYFKVQLGNRKR